MCGMAGAYMALAFPEPSWQEGLTNGFGWLALALILFGTWRPLRVLLGGLLFGLTISAEPRLQLIDHMPGWFATLLLPSLPYILPIIVLTLISMDATMIRRNAPGSLGKPFEGLRGFNPFVGANKLRVYSLCRLNQSAGSTIGYRRDAL